jgi:hypothetical protein
MCYIDGQNNKYSVLNECNRKLKYNMFNLRCLHTVACVRSGDRFFYSLCNVTIVGKFYYLYYDTATCFGHTTIIK